MARFQPFADLPHMSSGDNLPQDYELFPSQYESYPDPTMVQRPPGFQMQMSPVELPMKSPYFTSCAPWSGETVLSHHPGSLAAPSEFSSPWCSDLASSPGAESPESSSSWLNVGCYMSPPYTCDDTMLSQPGFDSCSSPAAFTGVDSLVAPSQLYPEPEPIVKLETQTENIVDESLCYNSPPQHNESDIICDVQSYPYPDRISQQAACHPPSLQSKSRKVSKPTAGRIGKRTRKPSAKAGSISAPKPRSKTNNKKDAVASQVFICSFSHFGCQSTFVSKNEWKRHVASQHIQPGFFRCDVGRCSLDNLSKDQSLESNNCPAYNETHLVNDFNRKDLFTQHQRRMHAPWVARNRKHPETDQERDEFEQSLEAVRNRCWHEQRKPPAQSRCGFCGQHFTGARSWNERMEHVGRHYEKGDTRFEAEDLLLRHWAMEEEIIRKVGTEWKLAALCEK
ncbi:C2H2 finger domain protein [Aspergillus ellipticus CBS 707.79]|uniref:C2H2 finger domain protein n=1 Tax=Aspergillus ellipticus CBS 707.79 TaxID=1448320 RepID=A0A319D979_9EURO|nr:C2H2 finger domain protein [Aspergillus ellipticus CBS 707.79]